MSEKISEDQDRFSDAAKRAYEELDDAGFLDQETKDEGILEILDEALTSARNDALESAALALIGTEAQSIARQQARIRKLKTEGE